MEGGGWARARLLPLGHDAGCASGALPLPAARERMPRLPSRPPPPRPAGPHPSTMQVVTNTRQPPQSNSVSYWVPPSSGEEPKKPYLAGGGGRGERVRWMRAQVAGRSEMAPIPPRLGRCAAAARPDSQPATALQPRPTQHTAAAASAPHLGRMTSTVWPCSFTARPSEVTTSPRPPTCGRGAGRCAGECVTRCAGSTAAWPSADQLRGRRHAAGSRLAAQPAQPAPSPTPTRGGPPCRWAPSPPRCAPRAAAAPPPLRQQAGRQAGGQAGRQADAGQAESSHAVPQAQRWRRQQAFSPAPHGPCSTPSDRAPEPSTGRW